MKFLEHIASFGFYRSKACSVTTSTQSQKLVKKGRGVVKWNRKTL